MTSPFEKYRTEYRDSSLSGEWSSLLCVLVTSACVNLPGLLAFLVKRITSVENKELTSCVLTENKIAHGSSKDSSEEMAAI